MDEEAGIYASVEDVGRERFLGFGEEVVVEASDGEVGVAVSEVLSGCEDGAIGDFDHEVAVEAIERGDVIVHDPMALVAVEGGGVPSEVPCGARAQGLRQAEIVAGQIASGVLLWQDEDLGWIYYAGILIIFLSFYDDMVRNP